MSAKRFLGVVLFLFLAGCGQAELYHGLDEREANDFIVKLGSAGIAAEKMVVPAERGEPTYTITVAKDKLDKAFHILEMYGLPRDKPMGISEVYPGGGLIPGPFEEKAKYLLALTGEIETTIRTIDRVVDARVHVVIPEESALRDEDEGAIRPTASVLIRYLPDDAGKKPYEDVDVKQLVARAVEGLNLNEVTVVSVAVKPIAAMNVQMTPENVPGGEGQVAAGDFTLEMCTAKFVTELGEKAKLRKVGPLIVHEESYKWLLGVLGGLAGFMLLFFVLWLIAFIQVASYKKKLAAANKASKVKKA